MSPDRIMDYNPDSIDGGVFEPGHSIWFRTSTGVTMLERIEDLCSDECVVVLATVASGLDAPYTSEAVRSAATITLVEDWDLVATARGTTLTKTWRDVTSSVELPFPLEDAIRETAKGESDTLVERWDEAARRET